MSVSACRFPARRDAANDTDLCSTPARHAPVRLPFPIRRVFRFCPLSARAVTRASGCAGTIRTSPGSTCRLASLLDETNVRLTAGPTHAMSPSRRVSSRLVSSRLVSTSACSSSPWLSSAGALDSRKNNYTEREDWVRIANLPYLRSWLSIRSTTIVRMNERTNGRLNKLGTSERVPIKIYPPRVLLSNRLSQSCLF